MAVFPSGCTYVVGADSFDRDMEYPRPVDARRPVDICKESGVSALLYTEKRRTEWVSSMREHPHTEDGALDVFSEFLDRFRYSPNG